MLIVLCISLDRPAAACASALTCASAGSASPYFFNAVDLYNSATGAWSTAQLSVARENFAATSAGEVAIFAGGITAASALLCEAGGGVDSFS